MAYSKASAELLRDFSRTLSRERERFDSIKLSMDSQLKGFFWDDPIALRFKNDYEEGFRPITSKLLPAMDNYIQHLDKMAAIVGEYDNEFSKTATFSDTNASATIRKGIQIDEGNSIAFSAGINGEGGMLNSGTVGGHYSGEDSEIMASYTAGLDGNSAWSGLVGTEFNEMLSGEVKAQGTNYGLESFGGGLQYESNAKGPGFSLYGGFDVERTRERWKAIGTTGLSYVGEKGWKGFLEFIRDSGRNEAVGRMGLNIPL